ncbi:hypothetical protein OF829_13660 [Sphingomonas sp. LB-2]|uniref:hypothetical protein n=1 Tax=Sphingomonas caeni TaxID=2984949 RepID=UPI002230E3DA|nr:hypothetical protein [Sphingomonas caeni]MCW3848287.1 hypothetical protein [Sphingomonas caeni]
MRLRLAVLLLAGCSGGCSQPTAEQNAIAADIEARVVLPKGAGNLKCYERYYAFAGDADQKRLLNFNLPGKRVVFGSYVVGKKPGVHWVASIDDFPDLQDAGCDKLNVFYIEGDKTLPIEASCSFTFAGTIDNAVEPAVTC